MHRWSAIAWALTLGSVLTLTGAVSVVAIAAAPAPGTTQAYSIETGPAEPGPVFSTEPWPAVADEACRDCPQDDPGMVTIVLGIRWGYLNDPPVAAFQGTWSFDDTGAAGSFMGRWHLVFGRASGSLQGRFTLPADGNGEFRGRWNTTGSRIDGSLWGAWIRTNATHGYLDGNWDLSSGRQGGALVARWSTFRAGGGGFRGEAIAAPSLAPVTWDGALRTTDGTVQIVRTVRFERDDHILPQRDRQIVGWKSTTAPNWDGVIVALRFPRDGAAPDVTLRTTQITFEWTARELAGLHVREKVDRAGHEIEVVGVLLEPRPRIDFARFSVHMRWGNLSDRDGIDEPSRTSMVWDGFAQVTYGGIVVERVLSFERGDFLLRPDNRVTVSWVSGTTTGWDGLVVLVLVPLVHLGDAHFTVHAGAFSHVFAMRELYSLQESFPVRGGGFEIISEKV